MKTQNIAILIILFFVPWTTVFMFTEMSQALYIWTTLSWVALALRVRYTSNVWTVLACVPMIIAFLGFIMDMGPGNGSLIMIWTVIVGVGMLVNGISYYMFYKKGLKDYSTTYTACLFLILINIALNQNIDIQESIIILAFSISLAAFYFIQWDVWTARKIKQTV